MCLWVWNYALIVPSHIWQFVFVHCFFIRELKYAVLSIISRNITTETQFNLYYLIFLLLFSEDFVR